MLPDYKDIRKRIKAAPKWFDSNGVPRYDKFSPKLCSSIYTNECCLLLILCQHCGERFKVEMYYDRFVSDTPLFMLIKEKSIHYGDPPQHGCVGDTMNCDDIKVLEYWESNESTKFEWKRNKKFEVMIEHSKVNGWYD